MKRFYAEQNQKDSQHKTAVNKIYSATKMTVRHTFDSI